MAEEQPNVALDEAAQDPTRTSPAAPEPLPWRTPSVWILGLASVGLAVRLRQYTSGRSLWLDEAMVANDLGERDVTELLTTVSPRSQMGPSGFWVLEKAASVVSPSALALRLGPLLAGAVLIALAIVYSQRHLVSLSSRIVLVGLMSMSPALIHYSAELKPYMFEAAVTMLLLLAITERHHVRAGWIAGIGVVALAFSFPALAIVPLLGLAWAAEAMHRDGVRVTVSRLWLPGLVLIVAEAIAGVFALQTRAPIADVWEDYSAYAPLPTTRAGLEWLARTATSTVDYAFFNIGIIGRPADDVLTDPLLVASTLIVSATVVVAAAIGVRSLRSHATPRRLPGRVRELSTSLAAAAAILSTMLVLSGLNIYPFQGRLTVYLFPLVFVVFAHSVDLLDERFGANIAAAAALVMLAATVPSAVEIAARPYDKFDMVAALEWIEGKPEPGDAIVFDEVSSGEAFFFHERDFDFGGTGIRFYPGLDVEGIAPLADGNTVWFLSAFVTDRNSEWVDNLLEDEHVVDSWRGDGVIVAEIVP